MRSTPPGRGPWGQNQQEPSKRTGPKCSYRKKRTPQSHGRQKRNSGGWREPQRQAPSVGSQQKSRAEYAPQQTEEPGAAGAAALGAGAEHIQIRDRATSEQNHAKQKERENTPRHPAHGERTRRRTDQFRSAGNGHCQQHARPRQQKNRNGGEGPLKRAPWKRELSNTKEMANSTKKAADEAMEAMEAREGRGKLHCRSSTGQNEGREAGCSSGQRTLSAAPGVPHLPEKSPA